MRKIASIAIALFVLSTSTSLFAQEAKKAEKVAQEKEVKVETAKEGNAVKAAKTKKSEKKVLVPAQ